MSHSRQNMLAVSAAVALAIFGSNMAKAAENVCPPLSDPNGETTEPKDFQSIADQRVLSSFVGVSECWSADVTNGNQQYLNDLYTSVVVKKVEGLEAKKIAA